LPQHKSAKKRVKTSRRAAQRNRRYISAARRAIKEFRADSAKSPEKMKKVVSLVDRAAARGVYHKNKTARIKSRLAKLIGKTTAK